MGVPGNRDIGFQVDSHKLDFPFEQAGGKHAQSSSAGLAGGSAAIAQPPEGQAFGGLAIRHQGQRQAGGHAWCLLTGMGIGEGKDGPFKGRAGIAARQSFKNAAADGKTAIVHAIRAAVPAPAVGMRGCPLAGGHVGIGQGPLPGNFPGGINVHFPGKVKDQKFLGI